MSEASNPRKVKVSGPAIEKPVKTFESTYLLVDCSEAGPGEWTTEDYITQMRTNTVICLVYNHSVGDMTKLSLMCICLIFKCRHSSLLIKQNKYFILTLMTQKVIIVT